MQQEVGSGLLPEENKVVCTKQFTLDLELVLLLEKKKSCLQLKGGKLNSNSEYKLSMLLIMVITTIYWELTM